MKSIFRFWKELRRRNVHKGIISYVIFSWVLLQVISVLGSLVSMPEWLGKAVLVGLLVFFPFWIIFSWLYDITPEGLKLTASKDSSLNPERAQAGGKKLNTIIVVFLVLAVVLLFVDRFRLTTQYESATIATTTVSEENSIAVLPFNDISLLKNQAYFADGLAEELIHALSKIIGIRVISRTSAFSFKGKTIDIPTIAKQLKVNYILEGSVRTYDSIVRVSVQLIDAEKDRSTWTETWDKDLSNILAIQNEISTNIAQKLELSMTDGNAKAQQEVDPEAYRLFLEAKYAMHSTYGPEGDEKAVSLLKQSVAIDSTFAPAWELMGNAYHFMTNYGVISVEEGYPLVKSSALKALEVDTLYATAYDILATMAIDYERDFEKAQRYIDKGLSIEPNNIYVLNRAAEVALLFDNPKKAIAYHEKLARLNPIDDFSHYILSMTYYFAREYSAAEKAMRKSIQLQPETQISYQILSNILLYLDRPEEALEAALQESSPPLRLHALSMVYHDLGDDEKAQESIQELIEEYEEDYSFQIAGSYAYMEDKENAYFWLEKAIEYQDFGLMELKIEPIFDPIKEDSRWPETLDKLGFLKE